MCSSDLDDQFALAECMFRHPDLITIDYSGALILTLDGFQPGVLEKRGVLLRNVALDSAQCFAHLVPALVTCLGNTQSPKLHKRVLMLLSLLVQRATEAQLKQLSPLQLGALLGALRVLLASPALLEQFDEGEIGVLRIHGCWRTSPAASRLTGSEQRRPWMRSLACSRVG